MRTVLALFCLLGLAALSVVAALYFFGLVRDELAPGGDSDVLKVASVASAYDAGDVDPPVADEPFPPDPEPPAAAEATPASSGPAEGTAIADATRAPRIIGGPGISPGPAATGPLQREAVPPPPPEPARWRRFLRVVITEPGLIDSGKRKLRLAGIVAPEDGTTCRKTVDAPELACSFLSVQALRQRIRALGVECLVSPDASADPTVAPCRIGKTDLSLWLISQGWASATADAPDPYREAEAKARCARLGLWLAGERPKDCPA